MINGSVLFLRCVLTDNLKLPWDVRSFLYTLHSISRDLSYHAIRRSVQIRLFKEFQTDLSSAILSNKGSNQPMVHSQWASRNVITWPFADAAPCSRARIRPDRLTVLRTCNIAQEDPMKISDWISNIPHSHRRYAFEKLVHFIKIIIYSAMIKRMVCWPHLLNNFPFQKVKNCTFSAFKYLKILLFLKLSNVTPT